MRGSSLESVRINYKVFHELWEEAKDIVKDSETRARIVGVQFYMKSFDYLFGMVLGERLLKHTDSKTLQSPSLTASDGQHIADLTVKTLQKIREEDAFGRMYYYCRKVLRLMVLAYQENGELQQDLKKDLVWVINQLHPRNSIVNSILSA